MTVSALSAASVTEIRRRLLDWYARNQRDLPWRNATDPYAILVSEFMLQQTGVERVRTSYPDFLARFPTFEALAAASRHEVLRAWAGLGYNRRAVHLHECAQQVVREHAGRLPDDPEALGRLAGIGPYTRNALLSFAFHRDVAALDTNVRRVIGRLLFGAEPADRALRETAAALVPTGRSSDWNQALMDFGSLQCTAAQPACLLCPLNDLCVAAPVGAPERSLRRVAEAREPYLGSRRYLRGRLVAVLRELPPSSLVPVATVVDRLPPKAREAGPSTIQDLLSVLAAEGLARLVDTGAGWQVGPP